ncbi:hemagglutinin repeat-containing protein [Pelosinus propionicus]|uniref:hemagglutinin repeat-containing protein n=1 Tax=Pelosinus propionicus TaxID=380084 RepID=UPI001C31AE8D|nr:hemagglutinin repeat-containing protein [Pelosinus propionicus]
MTTHGRNLAAGNLKVKAGAIDLSGSTTYAGSSAALTAAVGDLDNTGASLQTAGTLTATSSGTIRNDQDANQVKGEIKAGQLTLTAEAISNQGGSLTQIGSGLTTLTASNSIDNTGGEIFTNGETMQIKANSMNNTQGKLEHAGTGTLWVHTDDDFKNVNGKVASNSQINLKTKSLHNENGIIAAQKRLDITSASTINNSKGFISSIDDTIQITAQGLLNNQEGNIEANKGLNLTAQSLNNVNGRIVNVDNSDMKVVATEGILNQFGLMGGNGNVIVEAESFDNEAGQVLTEGNLAISMAKGFNNTDGKIIAKRNMEFSQSTADLNNNRGTIGAGSDLVVQAKTVNNNGGKLGADQDSNITAQSMQGIGQILAGQDLNISLNGDYTNETGNELKANRNLSMTTTGMLTNQGTIGAVENVNVSGSSILNDTKSILTSGNALTANTAGSIINKGTIEGDAVNLSGENIQNTGAIFGRNLNVTADQITNEGSSAIIATTGNASLYARTAVENKDDASIYSMGDIVIAGSKDKNSIGEYINRTGNVLNQSANIEAEKDISIYADEITNKKREFVTEQVVVSTNTTHETAAIPANPPGADVISGGYYEKNDRFYDEASLLPVTYSGKYVKDGPDARVTYVSKDQVNKVTTTEAKIIQDSPEGKILSGGNLILRAIKVNNELSWMLANGTLDTVADNVNNISIGNTRITTTDSETVYRTHHFRESNSGGGEESNGYSLVDVYATETIPTHTTTTEQLPGYTSLYGGGQGVTIQAQTITNQTIQPSGAPVGDMATTVTPTENSKIPVSNTASGIAVGGNIGNPVSNNSNTVTPGSNSGAPVSSTTSGIATEKNIGTSVGSNASTVTPGKSSGISVSNTARLDNEAGILQAGRNLTIEAANTDSNGGSLVAGKTIDVRGKSLAVDLLQAGEDATVKIEQDFTNRGQVQSNGALSIIAGGEVSNASSMIGLDNVSITGSSVTNAAGAAVKSGGKLEISGTKVSNQGTIYGKETVIVKAGKQLNTMGTIAGSADVEITAENIDATGTLVAGLTNNGVVGSTGDLTLAASKNVTAKGQNLAGGNLAIQGVSVDVSGSTTYAGHSASLTATDGNVDNSGGNLSAKEHLTIAAKNNLMNDAAAVKANQLQIAASDIDNRGGVIAQYGQSDLTINTGTLDNANGQIAGNSTNLTLNVSNLNNSQGQIQHAGSGELSVHGNGDLINTDGQIVGNGVMEVHAQTLNNDQGTISAKEDLTITANSLDNQTGVAVSNGAVSLDIGNEINNQSGIVEAGKTLTIAAKNVNNQNGKLTSLDQSGLTMTVQQDINNRTGLIGSNGAAAITTKSLNNTRGQVLSGASLGITASDGIDNTEGQLVASQDLTIEQEYADLMNSKGILEAGRNLELKAAAIDNAQGRLAANGNIGLTFNGLQGVGSVNAGNDLSLRVGGDFTNASGNTWQAVNDLSIDAVGSVTNSGMMEASKNLVISGQQVTNRAGATLVANDELRITAADDVTNNGSMFGNDVNVAAANIVNANETAAIASTNSVKLYAANGLENKDGALIYSMGNIDIAGSEVKSGEEYTNKAKSLLNQSANIEAEGDIVIYADDVVNKKREFEVEQTVISDEIYPLVEGEWYYKITTDADSFRMSGRNVDPLFKEYLGVKESNKQGYSRVGYSEVENYLLLLGQSGTETKIIKDSPVGKITAGKNLTFKTNKIINDNSWILAGNNLFASGEVVNKAVSGKSGTVNHYALVGNVYVEDWPLMFVDFYVHALYDEVVESESKQENITTARFGGGQQVVIDGTSISNVTVTPASGIGSNKTLGPSGQINAATVVNSNEATVNTGINSSINGSAVQGPAVSSIGSVGQTGSATIVVSGTGNDISMNVNTNVSSSTVQGPNLGVLGSSGQAGSAAAVETSTESSTVTTVNTNLLTDKPAVDTTSIESGAPTPNVSQVVAGEASTKSSISTGNMDPGTVAALLPNAKAETVKPPQTNNGGTITLPQNGLYTVIPDPSSKYLIETNTKFANYKTFISSDYLLDKLSYDPATTMKRLGDSFYEQKLVREQITELTGRVFLNGYDSAEGQYQALLQNGAAAADNLHLQVGVALSAEQQAALTSDLVWLVEQEVSGQKVLVPVVYLSALREGDLTNSGAIISADKVQISLTGDMTNTGTIQAIESTKIGAANVNNIGGSIDGGQLTQITSDQDILNLSGSISGNDILLTAGNDIISQTYTTTTESKHLSMTTVSNIATISAGDTLTAVAGQDLTLLGTNISAGSDINLSAQNIKLGVVTDTDHLQLIKVTEEVSNLGTTIVAGGNLNLQASQDMNMQAAKLSAGEDLTLMAGNNLQLAAVANSSTSDYNIDAYNFNNQVTFTNQLSSLQAGSALTMVSGSDMTLTGVQAAGNTITALSGGGLTLNSVTDSAFSDIKTGSSKNYKRNMNYDEALIGTNLAATGDIKVGAIDSITMAGSSAISKEGGITLNAGKDIVIEAVSGKHEALTESKKTKSGFLSKKTTTKRDYALLNEVVGSAISGETVDISTDHDLSVKASNIVATNDLNLTAGNDMTITSMAETGAEDHYSYTKKSGIFSGVGLGFTIGSKSEKLTVKEKTLAEIGSTIGSNAGNVTLTAGSQFTSSGAKISAGLDLDITGKSVTIDNTSNTYDSTTKFEVKQSGLSVSLGGTVVNKGLDAVNSIERAGQVADERLQALYAYKAYDDIKDLSKIKNTKDLKQSVNVSVSVGSSKSTSEQTVHMETVNISDISAKQNITITATGDDVNLTGAKIDAKDITIQAVGDINLGAAQNQQQTTSSSKSSSWGAGMQLGTGIFGSVSKGSSKENGTIITNSGSSVTAKDTLTFLSGDDTNIIGSKVKGDKVVAEIGGNLNIASLQDIDNYSAKTTSSGLSAGIGQGVTGSYSKGKTNSNYQSVTDQAGIYAGEGGFNIEVGGNTDLKGAVIASDATPDKNKLSTDTLTYSDIQNKAEYSASSIGVNLNTSPNAKYNEQGFTPNIGVPASGNDESTTKSAVANGTIEIRSNPNQDISNLSRDTSGSLNTLGKIFDKQTVQEQQELAKVFGEVAYEEVHKISQRAQDSAQNELDAAKKNGASKDELDRLQAKVDSWDVGGTNKVALHALVGGIMSDLGGSGFSSGAVGSGFNQVVQKELKNRFENQPDMWQWASAVVGATATSIIGGDAQAGASTAASGTKNNDNAWSTYRDTQRMRKLAANTGETIRSLIDAGIIGDPRTMECDYAYFELSAGLGKFVGVAGGFMVDKQGNVYAIVDGSAGVGIAPPITGTYGKGFVGNIPDTQRDDLTNALEGLSVGTTSVAGAGGNVSVGSGFVLSAEVQASFGIGKSVGARYAKQIFNIFE